VMLPFIHRSTEAFDLHLAGKTAEGVKLLSEIIEERKDIDTAYMRLADIYKETGQADEALKILQDGFLQLPSSYEIFLDNMKLLVDTGGIEKAIELFESARFRETELDPEAWNILGIAYSKKGDFSTAVRAFEQGLSIDGRDPELHNNLGNATYSYGIQEESPSIFQNCLEHYKKAIEIDPDYATPYFGLGQAYQQMGRLGDAVFCWEKALAINPDFPRAHRALALVHLTLGNKTKALEMLEDFKTRYYHLMPPAERLKLDNLMKECRR
jgi:tetratricopeptide (TPR) repeat protein